MKTSGLVLPYIPSDLAQLAPSPAVPNPLGSRPSKEEATR